MKNKNNWYVVTGAPSSGKTTVLEVLEKKGYKVYEEWARVYIDREMKRGKTINEIRKNELFFQKKILKLKMDFEKTLTPSSTIFLDRGIPDSVAYMRLCKFENDPILTTAVKNCSYKKVFLMELLEYQSDYARTESQEEAILLEQFLEAIYSELKMKVIRVPKMSITKRVNFILRNL